MLTYTRTATFLFYWLKHHVLPSSSTVLTYFSTLGIGIAKNGDYLSWGNRANLDETLQPLINKWHWSTTQYIRHKKKESFIGQVCIFVCFCICVWGQCFVTLKFVSTMWDPWAIAINCIANADNRETGSFEFSTPRMVALDTHQSCASAGILQAFRETTILHLGYR